MSDKDESIFFENQEIDLVSGRHPFKKFLKRNWFKIILLIFIGIGACGYAIQRYTIWQEQKNEIFLKYQKQVEEIRLKEAEIRIAEERRMQNKELLDTCIKDAGAVYGQAFKNECKERGLQDNCALPISIADLHKDFYKELRDECYQKYPQE